MEVPNQVLNSTPLVSVLVTTFRHAGYIEQCLNGILEQQVDFAFELLVGEDESTAGTREPCQRTGTYRGECDQNAQNSPSRDGKRTLYVLELHAFRGAVAAT